MFTYSLNNPINYSDRNGEDAVWVQEESNVYTMGHSGLLIQDNNGQWYYFFWGNGTGKENVTFYLIAVDVEGYDLNSAEDVAEIVDNALSSIDDGSDEFDDFRKRRCNVTSVVYFDGDYSATFTYLDALGQKAQKGSVGYNLLLRNCGQVCWSAMSESDERFVMTGCSVIPNMAFLDIRLFSQFTVDEYRDYLRIQNILAE